MVYSRGAWSGWILAAEALQAVVDRIASLDEPHTTNAERIHAIAVEVAP